MPEIGLSGSEGGGAGNRSPYPYNTCDFSRPFGTGTNRRARVGCSPGPRPEKSEMRTQPASPPTWASGESGLARNPFAVEEQALFCVQRTLPS